VAERESPQESTPDQRLGMETRLADQDRTLAAMHALEEALAHAAPGRVGPWRDEVLAALGVLDAATAEEYENAGQPDSLLSDIKRFQPRLRSQVRGVRAQYRQLRDGIVALRDELEGQEPDMPADFADIRQRMAWLLTALRHQRARESDLIYEAYYDVFGVDLGDDPTHS
jgi:hypothetical protein